MFGAVFSRSLHPVSLFGLCQPLRQLARWHCLVECWAFNFTATGPMGNRSTLQPLFPRCLPGLCISPAVVGTKLASRAAHCAGSPRLG